MTASQEIEVSQLARELRDAREQLTTTAEILEVIRNSLNDTQPVFDAIVQSGVRLFPGAAVSIGQLGFRRPSPEASSIANAALATSFVDSNCGYPDHRIERWPSSAAERYNHE